MHRFTKTLAVAAIGFGTLAGYLTEANACGGGGGRSFGGFRGHPQPRYVQPITYQQYPQQPYIQPQYVQPQLQQPPYQQQPLQQQPLNASNPALVQNRGQVAAQPAGGAGLPPTVRKMANVRTTGQPASQVARVAPQASAGTFQSSAGALQSLGGSIPASQTSSTQQIARRPVTQNVQRPAQRPPQQLQQQQIAQRSQQQQQQQSVGVQDSDPMAQIQLSALQALGGDVDEPAQDEQFSQAQPSEQPQPIQTTGSSRGGFSSPVGSWSASLPNGSKVNLTLSSDQTFSWVATSGDKTSSFEGSYTLSGGQLTLVRSSDNQKLSGSLTPQGSSSFTFKLTGAKDAGLTFSKS